MNAEQTNHSSQTNKPNKQLETLGRPKDGHHHRKRGRRRKHMISESLHRHASNRTGSPCFQNVWDPSDKQRALELLQATTDALENSGVNYWYLI